MCGEKMREYRKLILPKALLHLDGRNSLEAEKLEDDSCTWIKIVQQELCEVASDIDDRNYQGVSPNK